MSIWEYVGGIITYAGVGDKWGGVESGSWYKFNMKNRYSEVGFEFMIQSVANVAYPDDVPVLWSDWW